MNIFHALFTEMLQAIINITGDWVIAIALLTLAIKVILFPLSLKQQRSMLITQNLNQAKAFLTGKFKDKTDKVNNALAVIVSKYKINPISSFVPLILQAPVFISLYFSVSHLTTTAASALIPWVLDVTKSDTFHIAPLAASIFSGLQAWLTPGQTRNLLTVAVPVIIGLIFLWKAPVGLSIYWAVNSLIGLAEKKLLALKFIKERFLNVPSADDMVKDFA